MTLRFHPNANEGLAPRTFAETESQDIANTFVHERGARLSISVLESSGQVRVPRNAFLVGVHLGDGAVARFVSGVGRSATEPLEQFPGEICIFGPGTIRTVFVPFGSIIVCYSLPIESIRSFSFPNDLKMEGLRSPTTAPDVVMSRLSRVALELRQHPQEETSSIASSLVQLIYTHLVATYGSCADGPRYSGGLSPSSKRRVDEILRHPFDPAMSIRGLSTVCGLSAGHFARAFRQTYGRPFYRHLLAMRVEQAKELLLLPGLPLHEVALRTGYADQATFTESFTRATGFSPGRYRRQQVAKQECRKLTPLIPGKIGRDNPPIEFGDANLPAIR